MLACWERDIPISPQKRIVARFFGNSSWGGYVVGRKRTRPRLRVHPSVFYRHVFISLDPAGRRGKWRERKSFEKKEKSTLPSYGMYYGKAKGFWHQEEKGGREDDGRNRAHSIIKDWITPANWKKGGGRREEGGGKKTNTPSFLFRSINFFFLRSRSSGNGRGAKLLFLLFPDLVYISPNSFPPTGCPRFFLFVLPIMYPAAAKAEERQGKKVVLQYYTALKPSLSSSKSPRKLFLN